MAYRTKWASPLQLPYPSIMRGLDTLLRRVRSHSDIFYSHEYPRFAGADPAHIIFYLIGKSWTLTLYSSKVFPDKIKNG